MASGMRRRVTTPASRRSSCTGRCEGSAPPETASPSSSRCADPVRTMPRATSERSADAAEVSASTASWDRYGLPRISSAERPSSAMISSSVRTISGSGSAAVPASTSIAPSMSRSVMVGSMGDGAVSLMLVAP